MPRAWRRGASRDRTSSCGEKEGRGRKQYSKTYHTFRLVRRTFMYNTCRHYQRPWFVTCFTILCAPSWVIMTPFPGRV